MRLNFIEMCWRIQSITKSTMLHDDGLRQPVHYVPCDTSTRQNVRQHEKCKTQNWLYCVEISARKTKLHVQRFLTLDPWFFTRKKFEECHQRSGDRALGHRILRIWWTKSDCATQHHWYKPDDKRMAVSPNLTKRWLYDGHFCTRPSTKSSHPWTAQPDKPYFCA